MKQGLSIDLCPGILWILCHQLFLNFGVVLKCYLKLYITPGIFFKEIFPQNWGKWAIIGLLNLLKNLVITFSWIQSIMKVYTVYLFLHNKIGGNLVPETQAIVLSSNQIPEFLNQIYFQGKIMKWPVFLQDDTNS